MTPPHSCWQPRPAPTWNAWCTTSWCWTANSSDARRPQSAELTDPLLLRLRAPDRTGVLGVSWPGPPPTTKSPGALGPPRRDTVQPADRDRCAAPSQQQMSSSWGVLSASQRETRAASGNVDVGRFARDGDEA